MIKYKNYPINNINNFQNKILKIFRKNDLLINSASHTLKSDYVLRILSEQLINIGFNVERSKKKIDRICQYAENNKIFYVDAYHRKYKYAIEVEAGRAVVNYQFLKDFIEGCVIKDIQNLCIAIRKSYKKSNDYDKVCKFFDAIYLTRELKVPLKNLLIIGY